MNFEVKKNHVRVTVSYQQIKLLVIEHVESMGHTLPESLSSWSWRDGKGMPIESGCFCCEVIDPCNPPKKQIWIKKDEAIKLLAKAKNINLDKSDIRLDC